MPLSTIFQLLVYRGSQSALLVEETTDLLQVTKL